VRRRRKLAPTAGKNASVIAGSAACSVLAAEPRPGGLRGSDSRTCLLATIRYLACLRPKIAAPGSDAVVPGLLLPEFQPGFLSRYCNSGFLVLTRVCGGTRLSDKNVAVDHGALANHRVAPRTDAPE